MKRFFYFILIVFLTIPTFIKATTELEFKYIDDTFNDVADESLYDLIKLDDGYLTMSSIENSYDVNKFSLIKFDKDFNLLWKKDIIKNTIDNVLATSFEIGNYILAYYNYDSGNTEILNFDNNGDILWKKVLIDNHRNYGNIIQISDNNYIYASESKIIKFDKKGEKIIDKTVENDYLWKGNLNSTKNGFIILYGSEDYTNNYLVSYNNNCEEIWKKTFDDYLEILLINDDNIILYDIDKNSIIKLDSNGNELWNKKYDFYINKVIVDENSNLIITSNSYIAKLDSNGNELWKTNFEKELTVTKILISKCNTILLIGSYYKNWEDYMEEMNDYYSNENFMPENVIIAEFDKNGNFLNIEDYKDSKKQLKALNNYFSDLIESDNEFLLIGSTRLPKGSENPGFYVYKTFYTKVNKSCTVVNYNENIGENETDNNEGNITDNNEGNISDNTEDKTDENITDNNEEIENPKTGYNDVFVLLIILIIIPIIILIKIKNKSFDIFN